MFLTLLIFVILQTFLDVSISAQNNATEPCVTISADNMNIFYAGINNPLNVSVPEVSFDDIDISVTNATQVRTANGWNIRPTEVGVESEVTVTALVNGQKAVISSKTFRVKQLPAPSVKLEYGNKQLFSGGLIEKEDLLTATRIIVEWDDDNWGAEYKVSHFLLRIYGLGTIDINEVALGSEFTKRQLYRLEKTNGYQVIFITAFIEGVDGKKRKLPSLEIALK